MPRTLISSSPRAFAFAIAAIAASSLSACSAADLTAPAEAAAAQKQGGVEKQSGGGGGGGGKKGGAQMPAIPDFVFVSDASGIEQLYLYQGGAVSRFTYSDVADLQPHSAAGKIVFTSWRHGNAEVLLTDLAQSQVVRLTTHSSWDGDPSLSPDGSRVAFVSTRNGGTHRIWTMNADGSDLVALVTGSASYTPERAPRFSPDGQRLAFTSTRSGVSQVWVMPVDGGAAVQLTSETGGAFEPNWSPDGKFIYYTEAGGTPRIRRIDVAKKTVTEVATAVGGATEASCGTDVCLFTAGVPGGATDVVAVAPASGLTATVAGTAARERGATLLR